VVVVFTAIVAVDRGRLGRSCTRDGGGGLFVVVLVAGGARLCGSIAADGYGAATVIVALVASGRAGGESGGRKEGEADGRLDHFERLCFGFDFSKTSVIVSAVGRDESKQETWNGAWAREKVSE